MGVSSRGSLSRRSLMRAAGLASAGVPWTARSAAPTVKVIDAHDHLSHHSRPDWQEADRRFIDACDKLGINQACCSILPPQRPATPDVFRECNQWTYDAMRRFPGRVLGYSFVNPGYGREALEEVRRCIEDRGFIGIKLYNDYVVTEPVVWPVIELSIGLRAPILHHAGHASWLPSPQPRISDGAAFAEIGRRYPEAMIICAHICGGGDWEWQIKALRHASSIYLDTSGSVVDEGVLEMAVEILGADRLVFACDQSFTASVGRIRSANLNQTDRDKIYGRNMQRILARRGGQ
jgi:predicted TIM-barrel fold metal-dependent hydrolase